jgi:predicted nucleic acid-binding protein
LRFWDSSALLPLLVDEPSSAQMRGFLLSDPDIAVWWGARMECTAAIALLRRNEVLDLSGEDHVLSLLASLREKWWEVQPSEELSRKATRLLRLHALGAAEALQLGAAQLWFGGDSGTIVTFDERIAAAAKMEGLKVVPG